MAFQPAPDIAQIRIEGRLDRQMTLNDLYFQISGGGITSVNLLALAVAVNSWFGTQVAPSLSEDWTGVRVTGVDLSAQNGPSVESALTAVGGVANESAPGNVAACISFRTEQRGRFARGRNFLPGIPNSSITLNTLDQTFMDDITLAYGLLVGPGELLAGWQWVVLSRVFEGSPRAVGIGIPITSTAFTTNTVRSMRSREVGHGA